MHVRELTFRVSTTVLTASLLAALSISPATAEDGSRGGSRVQSVKEMALPQLQLEAAKLQAEFVRASLELEHAQLDLRVANLAVQAAQAKAERAQAVADAEADQFQAYLSLLYTQGPAMDSDLMVLLTGLDHTDAMWKQNLVFQEVTSDQATVTERALASQQEADRLHAEAALAQDEADAAEEVVQQVLAKISTRADEVTAAAESSITDNSQAALFNDAQQEARNTAAQAEWKGYLVDLKQAKIRPPDADRLDDPDKLPAGLEPVRGDTRKPVPGVATAAGAAPLTVLPKQVVTAVNTGFDALGSPYVAGNSGPQTYDCAGLVRTAYPDLDLGDSPAEQYEQTATVRRSNIQVGDLVFFATKGAGIHHVGIYLGGSLMLAADGPSSQVGVLALPGKPYAVTRPSLPPGKDRHEAPEGDGSQQMSCGAELSPGGATSAGMVYPVADGDFHFTSRFGDRGTLWASGFHTGLDFAAPVGTQVVAAREGTVSVTHPEWAGNLVTIDHGNGLVSRYAHLSAVFVQPGQHVRTGQGVGAVGQRGNATGPHLHFEVAVVGTPVDPMLFLSGGSAGGSAGWGGFLNGMIPASELCRLKSAPNHMLRCDAARSYDALALAYHGEFDTELCITDSYRSFASQVATFAKKPKLAAVPGTSNHGWGLAVDLCGGIENVGTAQHAWMQENAAMFGWVHPQWAEPGGGRPEPWHWEFGHVS